MDIATVLKSLQQPGENIAASIGLLKKTLPEFFFHGTFYLVGNAASIQMLKNALRELGVNIRNIKTQAYWAKGKPDYNDRIFQRYYEQFQPANDFHQYTFSSCP